MTILQYYAKINDLNEISNKFIIYFEISLVNHFMNLYMIRASAIDHHYGYSKDNIKYPIFCLKNKFSYEDNSQLFDCISLIYYFLPHL